MVEENKYFFIRAHPRSGTNWLSAILNLHPEIYCDGEFNFITLQKAQKYNDSLEYTPNSKYPATRTIAHESLRQYVRASIGSLRHQKPEAHWLGDRSASPILPLPLPLSESKYFYVVRDGRDVAISWAYHCFAWSHTFETEYFSEVFREKSALFAKDPYHFIKNPSELLDDDNITSSLAYMWQESVRTYFDCIATDKKAHSAVKLVRYEDLHNNLIEEIPKLYEFLDLDPKKAEPISKESKTTPGFSNNDPSNFYRKGSIGDWQHYFDDHSLEVYWSIAGEMMERFGYS